MTLRSMRLVVFGLAVACTPAHRAQPPDEAATSASYASMALDEGCGPCCPTELLFVQTPARTREASDVAQPIASRYLPEGGGGWRECIGNVEDSIGWEAKAAFELGASGRAGRVTVVVEPPQADVERCLSSELAKLDWPPSPADDVAVLAIYTRMAAFGLPP